MDPKMMALKSTTFLARRFTRQQLADVQETVELFPNDRRNELSLTICEHLNWKTPHGTVRVAAFGALSKRRAFSPCQCRVKGHAKAYCTCAGAARDQGDAGGSHPVASQRRSNTR